MGASSETRTSLRRALAPLALVRARLLRLKAPLGLAAVGVGVAAAGLALLLCVAVSARDRILGRELDGLDPPAAVVRVVWGGNPAQGGATYPELDRTARAELRDLQVGRPYGVMVLREASFHSQAVVLTALDEVSRRVRLRSGHLPHPCTPERCEVLQLAGAGPVPKIAGLNLVLVGQGSVRSSQPFGSLLSRYSSNATLSAAAGYHDPGRPPLFLARGVRALGTSVPLASLRRTYAWIVPLAGGSVRTWEVGSFLRDVTRMRSTLAAGRQVFDVTAPEEELAAANRTGRLGARRLLLLGGAALALLLAFVVLVGSARRRNAEDSRRRLTWLGAMPGQLLSLELGEALVVTAGGALVGWAVGLLLGAFAAQHWGSPVSGVVAHSAASAGGLAAIAAVVFVATALLVLSLRTPDLRIAGVRLTLADAAAVGAVIAIVIGLLRGAADADSLGSEGGTGVFLLILPGLLLFAVAVGAARLLSPFLRALERMSRTRSVPFRLSALSLARRPSRASAAVTFLTVSIGLALFALVYRATLQQARADQAAFAVPRDAVVSENLARLVPVYASAKPADYARLGDSESVVRASGAVPGLAGGVTVLGVPAARTDDLDGWRGDFADRSLPSLMGRIAPAHQLRLRGVRIPDDARTLSLPVRLDGRPVRISATIAKPGNGFVSVDFGRVEQEGAGILRADVPRSARGGRLFAFAIDNGQAGVHRGANAGLGAQPVAHGVLSFGALRADGRPITRAYDGWRGENGIVPRSLGTTAVLRYFLTPELLSRFVVRQETDGRAVPVVVSPAIAAAAGSHGELAVDLGGERLVAKVVGVARHFPSLQGDFVVADRDTLETTMNSAAPGAADPNEVWITAADDDGRDRLDSALHRAPFDELSAVTRRAYASELDSDPLGQGVLLALAVAAGAALALALAGVLLLLVTDLRDERGELFDLQAQGAEPATVQRQLELRAVLVTASGIVAGVVAGLILAALAVDFVRLTAEASPPEPPLVLSLGWGDLVAVLALYIGLVIAVAFASVRLGTRKLVVRESEASP
jgi:hypothetical protein